MNDQIDHAEVMNRCAQKAWDLGLESLTDQERVVALVLIANFEIELGGFSAFFYNGAGDWAAETLPALEAVGAKRAAGALCEAMGCFPGASPPVDRQLRYLGWKQVMGKLDPPTRDFYADESSVFDLLCGYIETHAQILGAKPGDSGGP